MSEKPRIRIFDDPRDGLCWDCWDSQAMGIARTPIDAYTAYVVARDQTDPFTITKAYGRRIRFDL